MSEQGELAFAEAGQRLSEIKDQIPGNLEVSAVREFIVGLTTSQVTGSGEKISYSKLCDGLKIVFKQTKNNPDLAREDEDGLAKIRITQQGENMTIVMRDDPSIADLAKLIRTIQIVSPATMSNPERMQEMNEWFDGLRRYSQNLRLAGLAMMRVVDKAMWVRSEEIAQAVKAGLSKEEAEKRFSNTEADGLLVDMADTIYNLGQAINVDKRDDGRADAWTEYEEIVRQEHNNDERVDARLLQGLKFARFGGDEDRQLRGKPGEEFDWMAEMLIRFGKSAQSERAQKMVSRIVDGVISSRAEEIKTKAKEATDKRDKLPMEMASTLLMRGIEKAYQQLGIPKWVKKFVQADLNDEKTRRGIYRNFDKWFSRYSDHIVFRYTGRAVRLRELQETEKLEVLSHYQEDLQTVGLGKENLTRFSDWFEDKDFFDAQELDLVKSTLFQPRGIVSMRDKFSWEDAGIKSVSEAVKFYKRRLDHVDMREEFAEFQERMLRMVAHEMQLNYRGWMGSNMSLLEEASPTIIIHMEALNCVGRSWLLAAIGEKLDAKTYAASTYAHVAVAVELANGKRGIIDPSSYSTGAPFFYGIGTVEDESGQLLLPGEEVVDSGDGERYLLVRSDKGFATVVLGNFDYSTGFLRELPVTEAMMDKYGVTTLANLLGKVYDKYYGLRLETLASEYRTTPDIIKKIVKRLNFLVPRLTSELKNSDFSAAINDLYKEIGI